MKIAYFDTIAGVSGDMTLGAFVSAGLPLDELGREVGKLNLEGVELQASHISRSGITAVKLDVVITSTPTKHRHLKDVYEIIDASSLSDRVKTDARKIFMEVAKAEAKVHNSTIEKVHFHEVGALDSIVDIVGAAICFEKFGIEAVYSSPVKLGHGGYIEAEHGKLPLPGPATTEILRQYPTLLTDIPFELTTPTGAAIIKSMSQGLLSMEQLKIHSIGYGAGTREIPQVPNLLRIMIGEMPQALAADELVMIETNIDDMNPEIYPYVIEKLIAAGANDAYLVPVIMKKGRPGILLSALTARSKMDEALRVIFGQTSTIGVRIIPTERKKLQREQREVQTKFGPVKVKAIIFEGSERLVPEFEECKRLAEAHKLPLMEVYKMVEKQLE
ncbi:MAG TPA: nickel pincer cofactor biosynthesis protein LarC [Bacteroidota bacterium]|jgi:uncharacterized protein (TIGR00299 family) protein|nr:nickel pincer cofactor biosynthesis protein LarC [Bacteroidota bacterium]